MATDLPGSDRRTGPRWWGEIGLVLGFYVIYTFVRNQFGSALGESARLTAVRNADRVIDLERAMNLFFEDTLQRAVIDWDWFIRFWNLFYGTFHFAVTIGVMMLMFLRRPRRYLRWRSVLLATTALALVGFAVFPLMPPRLLADCGVFGGCDPTHSFVDTLVDPGGLWSFDSGTMQELSNQFAAMPSLHIAWALWSALAAYPMLRRRWSRSLMVLYPLLTVFAIVVTANHYWIDAVGGAVVLGAGYAIGGRVALVLPGARLLAAPSTVDEPDPTTRAAGDGSAVGDPTATERVR